MQSPEIAFPDPGLQEDRCVGQLWVDEACEVPLTIDNVESGKLNDLDVNHSRLAQRRFSSAAAEPELEHCLFDTGQADSLNIIWWCFRRKQLDIDFHHCYYARSIRIPYSPS